jgi:hypothetical protein
MHLAASPAESRQRTPRARTSSAAGDACEERDRSAATYSTVFRYFSSSSFHQVGGGSEQGHVQEDHVDFVSVRQHFIFLVNSSRLRAIFL